MLVLSRFANEKLMLNGNIEVTVVEIRGNKVRLGISAPPEMYIHRAEVLDAIKRAGEKIYPMPCLSLPKEVYEHVEKMAAERKMSMDGMLSQWVTDSVRHMMAQAS